MENRNGLCVDVSVGAADGHAEREHALKMLRRLRRRGFQPRTLGADKGYDTRDFVHAVRQLSITPHIAPKNQTRSGPRIDGRTTRHPGFQVSQRVRKRIEEIFGWMKTIGGLRKLKYRKRCANPISRRGDRAGTWGPCAGDSSSPTSSGIWRS